MDEGCQGEGKQSWNLVHLSKFSYSCGQDLSFFIPSLWLWKLQCAHRCIGVQQEWILLDVYSSTRVSWWCLAGALGARQQKQWVLLVMDVLELQQHFSLELSLSLSLRHRGIQPRGLP